MDFKRFLIGVAFVISGSANASTVFTPTDGDVNFFNLTLVSGSTLAMFDDADTAFTNPLLVPLPSLVTIGGPDTFGNFTATNINASTLTLTNSPAYILGVNSGGGWQADVFSSCTIYANACTVVFADGTVLNVDSKVQVVPVPAAVWLFGTGLVGLVGVARRRS
jgi:hypothetical protein